MAKPSGDHRAVALSLALHHRAEPCFTCRAARPIGTVLLCAGRMRHCETCH
jgi:hypothetical protein